MIKKKSHLKTKSKEKLRIVKKIQKSVKPKMAKREVRVEKEDVRVQARLESQEKEGVFQWLEGHHFDARLLLL